MDGQSLPYAWNHSIIYDADEYGQMPYLVEQLATRQIDVQFNDSDQLLRYQLTAAIDKGLFVVYFSYCMSSLLDSSA